MPFRLFIDDQADDPSTPNRHPPEGWKAAKSVQEAKELVELHGFPESMDLDHDLALDNYRLDKPQIVMEFLIWLQEKYPKGENGRVPFTKIHTQNPVGRDNIKAFMSSWARFARED